MKISFNWLKNYVDLDQSPGQLAEVLNNIGLLVEDWVKRGNDIIFELETYANRPDTTGHLGVARELAAALGLRLKKQNWPLNESEERTSDLVDIQVWEEDLCPRYCGIVVKGITVGPSPNWLREKIEIMGLNPVNNVVDVTNYVLFSTAHPIHAFDLDKIGGQKIIIRRTNKGEVLRTLESKKINLTPETLVIADEKRPVALAGVIGGEETAVTDHTQNIFIESACFDPVSVRKTSKGTGIQTDASYRFERGADISFPPRAALMAASLLSQLGGKVTQGLADVYPKPRKHKTVLLRHHRITELLGLEIDENFVVQTLTSLEFQVELQQEGIWQVRVPHFRIDVEREADLIEEIVRFYGYDKIPARIPPIKSLEPMSDQNRSAINKIRQLLFHYGFDEVVNFSFSDPEKESCFNTGRKVIKIRNPYSSKAAFLKTSLIGGLLENIVWNLNRGAEGIHVFEVGNIYFWQGEKYVEQRSLALVSTGYLGTTHWQSKQKITDFFYLKGTCEALMEHLGLEPFSFHEMRNTFFEEKRSLSLNFKAEEIGSLGLLKQNVLNSYSLKDPVWAAWINLSALFEKQPLSFQYTPVIKYPSISRDITFITDKGVPYQKIKEAVEKLSISNLEKFDLYDRFTGSPIPREKVSLSFRFVFRHPKRTLLAEEVDSLLEKIINALKASFGFQLREGGKIDKRARKN